MSITHFISFSKYSVLKLYCILFKKNLCPLYMECKLIIFLITEIFTYNKKWFIKNVNIVACDTSTKMKKKMGFWSTFLVEVKIHVLYEFTRVGLGSGQNLNFFSVSVTGWTFSYYTAAAQYFFLRVGMDSARNFTFYNGWASFVFVWDGPYRADFFL